ncbi:MAG: glycosyltransferase family 39 protein [Bacteroidota bacterium]|nr:glycosyltransferase family 39 protein [Bacteroidota bacterium]
MENQTESGKNYFFLIAFLLSIPILLHLLTNIFGSFGIFRDELYYIACSNRLDTGYVDQPPLSIFILAVNRFLLGDSIFVLRLLPALNSGLTVLFTCLITIKLGGGKAAIIIASLATIFAPVYLGMNSIYSMNSFDILLWSISFYLIILIIENNNLTVWILLGIITGLGLLNKIGFLWIGFGFFAGLLLTDKRKILLNYKPYLTALIAFIIFSPYIIWNFQNDFSHIEFIRNATSGKYSQLNAKDFIIGQLLNMNPASIIVWGLGLYYFLFDKAGRKFRILGIIYVATFLILIINGHSKAEYLASAYTVLFAGGGVFIERVTLIKFKWLRYMIVIPIIILGLIITPLALPVLPVETYIKYANKLGFAPTTSEDKELSELPQFYADMFGWEEMAKNVSKVYLTIPENERSNVLFFGNNYGEAGAIEFFGKKYPLPKTISGHNNFWLWGFGDFENPIIIVIGGERKDHLEVFENVDEAGFHSTKYSMPYENNLPIFIGKKIKADMNETWKRIKNFE